MLWEWFFLISLLHSILIHCFIHYKIMRFSCIKGLVPSSFIGLFIFLFTVSLIMRLIRFLHSLRAWFLLISLLHSFLNHCFIHYEIDSFLSLIMEFFSFINYGIGTFLFIPGLLHSSFKSITKLIYFFLSFFKVTFGYKKLFRNKEGREILIESTNRKRESK